VALTDPVTSRHAPVPATTAEGLVFRQLYQTLIRLDCAGQAYPDLATSWSPEQGGRVWIFALPESARFWDGSPAGARDVAAGWAARWNAPIPPGTAARGVEALDDRRLAITLAEPSSSVPALLADPLFAIARPAPDSSWPLGTGAYRPSPPAGGSGAEEVSLLVLRPESGTRLPVLEFRISTRGDPRDLLDRGVDLLVASDPRLLEYARSRPEWISVPLPWTRVYGLLRTAAPDSSLAGFGLDSDPVAFRQSLARDAVRADSRAAEPPFWWDHLTGCGSDAVSRPNPAPGAASAPAGRIVYPLEDPTARDLAERLVALSGPRRLIAAGLPPEQLAAALQAGADAGYILALPRSSTAPCPMLRSWPAGSRVQALVETREHAVVRRGSVAWWVEGDGLVRPAPGGTPR
jgi:hypothetical protein